MAVNYFQHIPCLEPHIVFISKARHKFFLCAVNLHRCPKPITLIAMPTRAKFLQSDQNLK